MGVPDILPDTPCDITDDFLDARQFQFEIPHRMIFPVLPEMMDMRADKVSVKNFLESYMIKCNLQVLIQVCLFREFMRIIQEEMFHLFSFTEQDDPCCAPIFIADIILLRFRYQETVRAPDIRYLDFMGSCILVEGVEKSDPFPDLLCCHLVLVTVAEHIPFPFHYVRAHDPAIHQLHAESPDYLVQKILHRWWFLYLLMVAIFYSVEDRAFHIIKELFFINRIGLHTGSFSCIRICVVIGLFSRKS